MQHPGSHGSGPHPRFQVQLSPCGDDPEHPLRLGPVTTTLFEYGVLTSAMPTDATDGHFQFQIEFRDTPDKVPDYLSFLYRLAGFSDDNDEFNPQNRKVMVVHVHDYKGVVVGPYSTYDHVKKKWIKRDTKIFATMRYKPGPGGPSALAAAPPPPTTQFHPQHGLPPAFPCPPNMQPPPPPPRAHTTLHHTAHPPPPAPPLGPHPHSHATAFAPMPTTPSLPMTGTYPPMPTGPSLRMMGTYPPMPPVPSLPMPGTYPPYPFAMPLMAPQAHPSTLPPANPSPLSPASSVPAPAQPLRHPSPPRAPASSQQRSAAAAHPTGSTGETATPPQDVELLPQQMRAHPGLLKSLAQAHESWVFGALAELIDNARDADAKKVRVGIFDKWGHLLDTQGDLGEAPVLLVEDNGNGMDRNGMLRLLTLGHEVVEDTTSGRIGQYGMGFKSGTQRLGGDALVLSKHSESGGRITSVAIGFLSNSYNKSCQQIKAPIIILDYPSLRTSLASQTAAEAERCWAAIEGHTPFTRERVLHDLGKIIQTGTRIYIFNLRPRSLKGLGAAGAGSGEGGSSQGPAMNGASQPEHGRFELATVFPDRERKLTADIIISSRLVRSRSGQFRDAEVPLDWSLRAYLALLYLEPPFTQGLWVQGYRVRAVNLLETLKEGAAVGIAPKTYRQSLCGGEVELTVGFCAEEAARHNTGVMFYNNNRLIQSYVRCGLQAHKERAFGIVGVVVTKGILTPQNHKQGFVEGEELTQVQDWVEEAVGRHYDLYFSPEAVDMAAQQQRLAKQAVLGKVEAISDWIQCGQCGKWRRAPTEHVAQHKLAPQWYCWQHPAGISCATPEEKAGDNEVTQVMERGAQVMLERQVAPGAPAAHSDDGTAGNRGGSTVGERKRARDVVAEGHQEGTRANGAAAKAEAGVKRASP